MPAILPDDASDSEYVHLEEELVAAMEEENSRTKTIKTVKSKSPKRRKSSSNKSKAAVEAYSMPPPLVSPDTSEKLSLKYQSDSNRWSSNRRRLSYNQTYDNLNPPFMVPPQPGDDVTFEGQHFHYMDSFVPPDEEQPFALKSRSSSIVSLPLEQSLHEPILTPSSSSSSLSEFFRQQGPSSCEFNPATIFQEKDAEIIGDDGYRDDRYLFV